MSKREIPEINAGSMADIAFLLLIFFLVTTTMEREKAIIREIPIPIENQPIITNPAPVEERHALEISANDANQIMVRGRIMPVAEISKEVERFYQTNREGGNDIDYTYYTYPSEADFKEKIPAIEKQVAELSMQTSVTAQQFLTIKEKELEKVNEIYNAFALFRSLTGLDKMPLLHIQAHVKVVVMPKTTYNVLAQIHAEIQEALFNMRDKECERLFKTNYASLRRKNDNDQYHKEGKAELFLLELLYPENIIEANPNK